MKFRSNIPLKTSVLAVSAAFAAAAGLAPAKAQAQAAAAEVVYEYAAKIVCGASIDPKDMRLAHGFYATTVNVHNPNEKEVRLLRKTLALTIPDGGERPGKVFSLLDAPESLKPGQALATECEDIRKRSGLPFPSPGLPYIEGFVVIQSTDSLDVVAVYTTAALGGDATGNATVAGQHSSIHVLPVAQRRKAVGLTQPDLVPLPLGPNGNFCKRVATPNGSALQFRVQNSGGGAAGASTTRVEFAGHPPVAMIPTVALGSGQFVDLLAPIPPGAFDPDVEFRIEVDTGLVVPESNEGNNTASGVCLG
ncbi:MAG: CARDB domain-containing protein [Betaproteobacteria bacterium]